MWQLFLKRGLCVPALPPPGTSHHKTLLITSDPLPLSYMFLLLPTWEVADAPQEGAVHCGDLFEGVQSMREY
jgi:hypothetical protein